MGRISHLSVLAVIVTLTASSVVKSPTDGTFELLILHNNDMHARFEQTSQLSGACTTADRDAGKCYGGFPRVATVVKEARAAAASGEGPPVLYLNAGDTYTGTAWFTLYKWKVAAEFLNALQPDAVSLGNNEFEEGPRLSPFLENIEAPILASNIIVHNTDKKQRIHKSLIINVDNTQVGLVGYLTPDSKILDSAGDIEYIDEILSVKEEVANLQAQNVKIIIALGHSEQRKDIEIATEVDGIDLVITGYKNSFFWNGTNAEVNSKYEDQVIVTQVSGKRVPIFNSYAYNKYLGKVHLQFDSNGEIIDYQITPVLLDTSISQDPESSQMVNKFKSNIAVTSATVLGNTAVVLDGKSCSLEECNLGNLVADSVMYYHAVRFQGERWTNAPIAVIHGGAFAGSIAPSNRPAPVTVNDLLSAIPSQNNMVIVTMNGTILIQMLEHSVADYRFNNPSGQFLQFSGIQVVYDLAQNPGSRIVRAVARCANCFVPEFFTIDDWRHYSILMPASLANGQYGYSMLAGLPQENLDYDEITCTSDFIRLRSPVYPEVSGRIVLLNTDSVPDSAVKMHASALLLTLITVYFVQLF